LGVSVVSFKKSKRGTPLMEQCLEINLIFSLTMIINFIIAILVLFSSCYLFVILNNKFGKKYYLDQYLKDKNAKTMEYKNGNND
jgi:hypothetical protein